jgi:hypothetical protein
MGSGNWDFGDYISRVNATRAAGRSTFDYSNRVRSGEANTVSPLLDPLVKAGDQSPFAGQVMREVSISTEHPQPTPIAIVLDVTGSNYEAAMAVHAKLPQLFSTLQGQGFISDPQVMIAATGDANSDQFPIQVGQFESDNRIDDMVGSMILEGNGGGQGFETYEVLAYYLARHTNLEIKNQGRKGYAIFIGDEKPYTVVRRSFGRAGLTGQHTLESLTGDKLTEDIPTAKIFEELKEQYDVFFLFQRQGAYRAENVLPTWRQLIGENAVVLEDPNNVCEFIAGLLAMREGNLEIEDVVTELNKAGFDPSAVNSAAQTLAGLNP